MKRQGFTFLECILAVVIISILVITMFPIINTSFKQFQNIEIKNELRNIAQSTIETLKSKNSLSNELLDKLELRDEIEIKADYIKNDYKCIVRKLYNSNKLIEVEVLAIYYNGEEVDKIGLKASIRKQ